MSEETLNRYRQVRDDVLALLNEVRELTGQQIDPTHQDLAIGAIAGVVLDLHYYIDYDDRNKRLVEFPYPYNALFGMGEASGYLLAGLKAFPKQQAITIYEIKKRLVDLIVEAPHV